MTLSRQLNAAKVLAHAKENAHKAGGKNVHDLMKREHALDAAPDYLTDRSLPKHAIPGRGIEAKDAYDLIHNELTLDGTPLLNLASFVHTHMDEYGDKLCLENIQKNLIDSDEYESTTLIHTRCVSMIAKLWHADETKNATGTATTGSSEAIQLAGLAMKRNWQEKMRKAGKDEYPRNGKGGPNIVMASTAQVALEKFARYFECEMRLVPVSKETNYVMSPTEAMKFVDENTIGIFVILGSTYTGAYEDVVGMNAALDEYEAKTGISIPIHVDAASGGFVAPFATPKHVWDFKVPRVVSINSSGHKYGKAYVGVGWVIWRDAAHLPSDLVFKLFYLGSEELSFSLNFSRPAHPIIAQYYNFLKFGFEGYRKIALHDAKNARLLARAINLSKYYEVVSDLLEPADQTLLEKASQAVGFSNDIEYYRPALPVVSFRFSPEFHREFPTADAASIQHGLRQMGWIVPAYNLPPNCEDIKILRVVMREQFSEDLVERLVADLIRVTEQLMKDLSDRQTSTKGEKDEKKQKRTHHELNAAKDHDKDAVDPKTHASVC